MTYKKMTLPLSDSDIKGLRMGDAVLLSGCLYAARDAAHKRLIEMIENNQEPPFEFNGQAVYYAGPSPARPTADAINTPPVGSAGPTTSGRMDKYAPALIERGLKVMIGKGLRSQSVKDAIVKHNGVYFAAIGGAGALIAQCITKAQIVAFDDLGTEAVWRLTVCDLPVFVAVDCLGNDIYLR